MYGNGWVSADMPVFGYTADGDEQMLRRAVP
jgi:hypothetical protein